MTLSNGRLTYNELRNEYEKVYIRHQIGEDGTARTTCLLVRGDNVFVGVSKFSNRTFNFSKKKGRAIAQGRAELAHAIYSGKVDPRESMKTRREQLCYTITASPEATVNQIVDNFIGSDE